MRKFILKITQNIAEAYVEVVEVTDDPVQCT